MDLRPVCLKCQGRKRIMGKDGTIRPCFDCLQAGEMDQHSRDIKESKVRV